MTTRLTVANADDTGHPILIWHQRDGSIDAIELELEAALALMAALKTSIEKYGDHSIWSLVSRVQYAKKRPDPTTTTNRPPSSAREHRYLRAIFLTAMPIDLKAWDRRSGWAGIRDMQTRWRGCQSH